MTKTALWIPKLTPALAVAKAKLEAAGVEIRPDAAHWLLPVPSRDWKPEDIPEGVTVLGGGLNPGVSGFDFLKNEDYLWANAAITADCTLEILAEQLPSPECRILILGWGRIAKHLALRLAELGADVTVGARKAADRAMAASFGLWATDTAAPGGEYDCIINTVPEMIWPSPPDCVAIDLASRDGIAGEKVIRARGLPGKMAPREAGALIARTVLNYFSQEGTQ